MAHMAAPHMFKSACSTYSTNFLLEMFDVAARFSIKVSGLGTRALLKMQDADDVAARVALSASLDQTFDVSY